MAGTGDISTLIVATPGTVGGRPRIAGTRLSVQHIAGLYRSGLDAAAIAREYGHVTVAQVAAALAYYHANRATIDAAIAADDAEYDRLAAAAQANAPVLAAG